MGRPYRAGDVQRQWVLTWKVFGGVVAAFVLMPFLPMLLFVPMELHMLWEKAMVKEFFLVPVAAVESPEGTQYVTASREGILRLVEKKTGKVLKMTKLSPKRYTTLEVMWQTPQKIGIFASFRYGAMARGESLQWNLQTGNLQELHLDGTLTDPETE